MAMRNSVRSGFRVVDLPGNQRTPRKLQVVLGVRLSPGPFGDALVGRNDVDDDNFRPLPCLDISISLGNGIKGELSV